MTNKSKVDNLPDAYIERWNAFLERVNEIVVDMFDLEEDHPSVVLGLQFGEMGQNPDYPVCVATTSLPVCLAPAAAHDVFDFLEALHEDEHGENDTEGIVREEVSAEVIPEEIRAQAEAYAEQIGVDPSKIKYVMVADTDGLDGDLFGDLFGDEA